MSDRNELRRRIRAAVERHVLPVARQADATRTFQRAPLEALAGEGLVGAPIPADFGGGGWSNLDSILVYEEISERRFGGWGGAASWFGWGAGFLSRWT